jgi:hypothetical protein
MNEVKGPLIVLYVKIKVMSKKERKKERKKVEPLMKKKFP